MLAEQEYRQKIQETFKQIEESFESIDPDLAECEYSMGSVTISLKDRSRCILSAQPSVQQLWLALASQGMAYHFNYDLKNETWVDDKGLGISLVPFLEKYFSEVLGMPFQLRGSNDR